MACVQEGLVTPGKLSFFWTRSTPTSYMWSNNITQKPTIYSMDVANFFPSVPQYLALPAISKILKKRKLSTKEISAVVEGLKLVRDGNFFKWKDQFYNQISGCALGDPDSCSYTDITMADLLDKMVPACQETVSTNMDPFFKIYRDDGLGITFENPAVILKILEFFNNFESSIQWTIPSCLVCHQPQVLCPHYDHLEFLDCKITWKKVPKGGLSIWQFQVSSYSKPTDCHAYLSPSSCSSPHLTKLGISLAKTVGMRLRAIHTNDYDLLASLNEYSGYMVARGYEEDSIKFHLSAMANRSRTMVLKEEYRPPPQFSVPFVSTLHPATTVLSKLVKTSFSQASSLDNLLEFIIPKAS